LVSHVEIRSQIEAFENRVLRSIFGPKRDEVTEGGENYIMRSFIIYTLSKYYDEIKENKMGGGM
jgi:hypothetical protein